MRSRNIKKSEYYQKRAQEHSKHYNDEENFNYFKLAKLGIIVSSYPESFEKEVYEYFTCLLEQQYPELCDRKSILDKLSLYGRIYTAKVFSQKGIYHLGSGNILIYAFLNRLDDTLVHELVHKLGFMNFDESFYNMPKIFQETGAEIVTNTILGKPLCRENILGRMWGRCIGAQPAYLLDNILVSQLNQICNNQALEKSIIQGKNIIEPELIELLGNEKYVYFLEKAKELCLLERKYWKKPSKRQEKAFEEKMTLFQDELLQSAFDIKFAKVETAEAAKKYLEELMQFSDYRIKILDGKRKDEFFCNYFNTQKLNLRKKFGEEFEIKDIQETWDKRFPTIKIDNEKRQEELLQKKKIDDYAELRVKGSKRLHRFVAQKEKYPRLEKGMQTFKVDEIKVSENMKTNNKPKSNYER